MSKRARINTEDVLLALGISYDDEDEFEVDDPDKSFMDRSDDDFSDLDGEEDDADDNDMDTTPSDSPLSMPSQSDHSSPSAPPDSSLPDDLPQMWTTSLKPVTIKPFQSAVGPTVPMSNSPLEVFQLFFTTPLQMIVDESNRYWYINIAT